MCFVAMLGIMMMLVVVLDIMMPVMMMFCMKISFNPTDIMDGEVACLAMAVFVKLMLALQHMLRHLLVHTWMSQVINDWCTTAVGIVEVTQMTFCS